MPDGNLRRPPQPWESKLAKVTGNIGAGVSAGNATSIVPDPPPPGIGGGIEPAPVLPPPGDFIAPSTPTLLTSVQGINVVWNGLNSAGDLWPSDTSYVEVHMDTTGPTFTVGTATLKGRLARPGGLSVVGLDRGTTYYFRLRGADPAGNVTAAGSAASGQPGQISAPDIAANAITANSIVAGTITGWSINSAYLSGGTVSGGYISGGTVSGGYISGGTVSGGLISGGTVSGSEVRTGTSGRRVAMKPSDFAQGLVFENLSTTDKYEFGIDISNRLDINGTGTKLITTNCDIDSSAGLDIAGSGVFMQGVYDNNTTGIDSVGINSVYRLRRISSTQAIKYDIAPLTRALSASVEIDRIADVVTVDPAAILDVAVAEFSVIDDGEATDRRVLGFIADDVADKLPIAVTRDEAGAPAGVLDTSLIAALLAVVQQQQADISALTARIEALEG